MKSLEELVDTEDPGLSVLSSWLEVSPHQVDVLLPTRDTAERCLVALQVSTRSLLGAVAYETGGLLVADGWLRILGSGAPALPRSLESWNGLGGTRRHEAGLLIADDAGGGFFSWESATRTVAYFSPDTLVWEDTGLGYSDWLRAMLGEPLLGFYEGLRWDGWRFLAPNLDSAKSMFFYPPRFTAEGRDPMKSFRGTVPVEESWGSQQDLARQLASARAARDN